MFIFVLTIRHNPNVCTWHFNGSSQHADKEILLKMVIYWPKHVDDDKLKHLLLTLDIVLKKCIYIYVHL
jgi:hypothetical protein